MNSPCKPAPPNGAEDNETHFERLAKLVQLRDRRAVPFIYEADPPASERRRWNLAANVSAPR